MVARTATIGRGAVFSDVLAAAGLLEEEDEVHGQDRPGPRTHSFSALSKPNFAIKYAFESSRRDLHNALLCTALKSQFF